MDKRKLISIISGPAVAFWSIREIMGCLMNISNGWALGILFILIFIFSFGLIFWFMDYFTVKDVNYKYWKIGGVYIVPVLIISLSFGFLMVSIAKKTSGTKKDALQAQITNTQTELVSTQNMLKDLRRTHYDLIQQLMRDHPNGSYYGGTAAFEANGGTITVSGHPSVSGGKYGAEATNKGKIYIKD
jgi:hypothetical protein